MIWHACFNVWYVTLLDYSRSTEESLSLGVLLRVQVLFALLPSEKLSEVVGGLYLTLNSFGSKDAFALASLISPDFASVEDACNELCVVTTFHVICSASRMIFHLSLEYSCIDISGITRQNTCEADVRDLRCAGFKK